VQEGHHTSYIMLWWGVTPFLQERCDTGAWLYQQDVLQGVVKPLNMTLFSGLELVFQQDSAPAYKAKMTQVWLWRNLLVFNNAKNWPLGVQTSTPWSVNCGLFWRTWLPESITTTWRAWRDPPGDSACGDSRVARASQRLRRGRGWPFWVTLLWMKT
jgi:hypothetical protein